MVPTQRLGLGCGLFVAALIVWASANAQIQATKTGTGSAAGQSGNRPAQAPPGVTLGAVVAAGAVAAAIGGAVVLLGGAGGESDNPQVNVSITATSTR